MIPKIIHQIWIGDQSLKPKYMDMLKKMNPTWNYMFWSEKEIKDEFGELRNQKHFDDYFNLKRDLAKFGKNVPVSRFRSGQANLIRYEVLEKFGGFYVDADAIPIQPFPDWFCEFEFFSVYENEVKRGKLVANGFLASTKNHPIIQQMIENIAGMRSITTNYSANVTGPYFLTKTLQEIGNQHNVKIFPSHFFLPVHYSGIKTNASKDEIFCDHFWGTTKNNYNKYNV